MQILTYEHKTELYKSNVLYNYFKDKSFAVFDIETLGLDASRAACILAGLNEIHNDGTSTITQFFAESIEEEPELLNALFEKLNTLDYVITYNGKHFDIPFILKRAEKCHLDVRLKPYNMDIFLMIRSHSELKNILPNLKQKTVEEYMGLNKGRLDEISGKESIELYYHYLLEEDLENKEMLKKAILLHNHDDVNQLYNLMPILRNVDVHKAMYSLGFPCNNGYVVEKIKANNRNIDVTGHYYGEPRSFVSFKAENSPFECEIRKDWTFSLKVPIEHIDSGNFIDLNAILPDSKDKFEIYPGFVNDYLILDDNSRLNYLEINMLVKEIVNSIIM